MGDKIKDVDRSWFEGLLLNWACPVLFWVVEFVLPTFRCIVVFGLNITLNYQKKDLLLKYMALRVRVSKNEPLLSKDRPYLASIAILNFFMSRKPAPPMSFGIHIQSPNFPMYFMLILLCAPSKFSNH